jgi:hypothetical protein
MESYPSNSHKKQTLKSSPEEEPKKVEKVIEGEVLRRKKPFGKRVAETFIGGDAKSVGLYVLYDVLLPAVKDTLADAMSQGVERMLFGEARSTSRRTGNRPGSGNSYISYNRYAPSSNQRNERNEWRSQPGPSRRARATHNFDEIILATRVEAEEVIDRLFDLVSRYESATVADLYELVGVSGNFADEKWGWSDIRGAGVTRVRNGYLLDLPKPEPLE